MGLPHVSGITSGAEPCEQVRLVRVEAVWSLLCPSYQSFPDMVVLKRVETLGEQPSGVQQGWYGTLEMSAESACFAEVGSLFEGQISDTGSTFSCDLRLPKPYQALDCFCRTSSKVCFHKSTVYPQLMLPLKLSLGMHHLWKQQVMSKQKASGLFSHCFF